MAEQIATGVVVPDEAVEARPAAAWLDALDAADDCPCDPQRYQNCCIEAAVTVAIRMAAVGALRQAAEEFVRPREAFDSIALEWVTEKLRQRADELERGGDRPLEWYEPHDHGDGVGSHQHFPANGGHGSHEGVQLVAYRPERGGDGVLDGNAVCACVRGGDQ